MGQLVNSQVRISSELAARFLAFAGGHMGLGSHGVLRNRSNQVVAFGAKACFAVLITAGQVTTTVLARTLVSFRLCYNRTT